MTFTLKTLQLDLGPDGILVAALDVPGRQMNTITPMVIEDLGSLIGHVRENAAIAGLVVSSAKTTGFCAGADLGDRRGTASATTNDDELRAELADISRLSGVYRALETCGKPVASAIDGLALGGGLELVLATHFRVATSAKGVQLGLPEINVGLMPGAGGTQRVPRLLGLANGLDFLMGGKSLSTDEALKLGLIHQVVEPGGAIAAAKAWISGGGAAVQPWDRKGFRIPGGDPYAASGIMAMAISGYRKKTSGNLSNGLNLLKSVYEGSLVPIGVGLAIEARYMLLTLRSPQAKAMVRTQFFSMQALKKGAARPADVPSWTPSKIGILGAGMMGAGIALVSATAGIPVILLDRDEASAAKGKAGLEMQLAKAVDKGRMAVEQASNILNLITPSADFAKLHDADIVVEAVFEDRGVKADVTRRAEAHLPDTAIFGSNTSSLPISELAEASARPENFIGMHFFSPVDRMALVEIIRGQKTSDDTLARTLDFVMMIRKTPIVVRDNRGFYTSRTFGTYLSEGFELLEEGVPPALIDNIGRMTGMPRGPLELSDDVGLDLCLASRKQARADFGDRFTETAQDRILTEVVETRGRHGRKSGKGLYDYPADSGHKRLWNGLSTVVLHQATTCDPSDIRDIRDRLLYTQALEAARIFAEGVIDDPRTADVGALLGWGFPGWTGGPLSLIDQIGAEAFVARSDDLARRFGDRYRPPQHLRAMGARGDLYYPDPTDSSANLA